MKVKSLKEVLNENLKDNKMMAEIVIKKKWKEIIGENLYKKSEPIYIKNGILYIGVENSAWIQQMRFMHRQIIKNINDFLGNIVIKDIRLKAISNIMEEKEEETRVETPYEIEKKKNICLDEDEIKNIKKITQEIKDEELKKKIYKMMKENFKRKKFLKTRGANTCVKCGEIFSGSEEICPLCKVEKRKENEINLKKTLLKKPYITFYDAKAEINNLNRKDFYIMKDKVRDIFYEEIKIAKKEKKEDKIKTSAAKYIMLQEETKDMGIIGKKILKLIKSFT